MNDAAENVDLGSLAEIVMGTSPPGSSYNYDAVGEPLLNGPTEFGPRHPIPVLYTTKAKRFAEFGDLLFCVRGSTTGRMNWADRRYAIGRGVAAVRGSTATETAFLRAAIELALPGVLAGATGSTMPNLSLDAIRRIPIPLNPERVRVGTLLRAIDDLIDNNRRRVELLEEMARATYREWFVRFHYQGHERVPLVDSPVGRIPEGWGASALSDLVSTQYGYTESATNEPIGPRYLRGMDINKTTYVDWATVPYCSVSPKDLAKFSVERGDVFVIRMADPGKVGMCEVEVDAVFASYLVRLRPVSGRIDPYFLYFTLRDDPYQGWVTGASTGATRRSVSAKVMTEPCIALPPTALQARFRNAIEPIRKLLNSVVQQNGVLGSVRAHLLPRLVTGRIDVSLLDLDALTEAAIA